MALQIHESFGERAALLLNALPVVKFKAGKSPRIFISFPGRNPDLKHKIRLCSVRITQRRAKISVSQCPYLPVRVVLYWTENHLRSLSRKNVLEQTQPCTYSTYPQLRQVLAQRRQLKSCNTPPLILHKCIFKDTVKASDFVNYQIIDRLFELTPKLYTT